MPAPPKVRHKTEGQYRRHFERVYCRGPIVTPDGLEVRFRKRDFDHCMYKRSPTTGARVFLRVRAERIDWIKATLEDPSADVRQGWDRKKKRIDPSRRVAIAYGDYAVVVQVLRQPDGSLRGSFVTAYSAGPDVAKMKSKPRWVRR